MQTGCARPVFLFNAVAAAAAGTLKKRKEKEPRLSHQDVALYIVLCMHITQTAMNVSS